jgi:hypothetical protein
MVKHMGNDSTGGALREEPQDNAILHHVNMGTAEGQQAVDNVNWPKARADTLRSLGGFAL